MIASLVRRLRVKLRWVHPQRQDRRLTYLTAPCSEADVDCRHLSLSSFKERLGKSNLRPHIATLVRKSHRVGFNIHYLSIPVTLHCSKRMRGHCLLTLYQLKQCLNSRLPTLQSRFVTDQAIVGWIGLDGQGMRQRCLYSIHGLFWCEITSYKIY